MGTRLIIPYKPREVFKPYHASLKRWCLSVAHRRAGKTVARINKLIRKAVECELPNPRFRYIAPYYVQAKDIAWVYLKQYSSPIISMGGKINESELSVTFPHNNAVIRLYGAENSERMRGVYSDGDVIDEAQSIPKQFLTQIILPSLADREGWLDVSGTPSGWFNLLGELFKTAKNDPEWFVQVLKASETGLINAEELARQRLLMTENEYDQEFECSFDAALESSYYGKLINEADADGRITKVPYNPSFEVNTAWDIGGDGTGIWFFQRVGREPRLIDHYGVTGSQLQDEVAMLKAKRYNYGTHVLPHDAGHDSVRTGMTMKAQLEGMGLANCEVLPRDDIDPGIQLVRQLIPQLWMDAEKCAEGIDALRNYQRKWNKDHRVFSVKPLHNWASHSSDSLRYLAVWLAMQKAPIVAKPEPFLGFSQTSTSWMS